MANIFPFSTQSVLLEWTEDLNNLQDDFPTYDKEIQDDNFVLQPIHPLQDVIVASINFCVGLVLNALIMRCYWSFKTSTAVYIRVLAVYDVIVLLNMSAVRFFILIFPTQSLEINLAGKNVAHLLMSNAVLGPLFMALDRILIVAFPHSFKSTRERCVLLKL